MASFTPSQLETLKALLATAPSLTKAATDAGMQESQASPFASLAIPVNQTLLDTLKITVRVPPPKMDASARKLMIASKRLIAACLVALGHADDTNMTYLAQGESLESLETDWKAAWLAAGRPSTAIPEAARCGVSKKGDKMVKAKSDMPAHVQAVEWLRCLEAERAEKLIAA
jgi:hypothetical protein